MVGSSSQVHLVLSTKYCKGWLVFNSSIVRSIMLCDCHTAQT